MTDQQHDPGEWGEPARSAPPAPQAQGPQRVELHKPFRTGMFLGFGFMVAWLIVTVVVVIVFGVLGVGLAGLPFSGLGG